MRLLAVWRRRRAARQPWLALLDGREAKLSLIDTLAAEIEESLRLASSQSDIYARVVEHLRREDVHRHVALAWVTRCAVAIEKAGVPSNVSVRAVIAVAGVSERDVMEAALGALVRESVVPGRAPERTRA